MEYLDGVCLDNCPDLFSSYKGDLSAAQLNSDLRKRFQAAGYAVDSKPGNRFPDGTKTSGRWKLSIMGDFNSADGSEVSGAADYKVKGFVVNLYATPK